MQTNRRALIVAAVTLSVLALLGLELSLRPDEAEMPPAFPVQAAGTEGRIVDPAQGWIETSIATLGEDRQLPRVGEAASTSSASASMRSERFLDPSEIVGDSGDSEYRSIGEPMDVDDHVPPEGVPVEYGEPLDADDPGALAPESLDGQLHELGEPMDADAPWYPSEDRWPPVSIGQPLDADADHDL